jgi:RNA recognition motif-containing protein
LYVPWLPFNFLANLKKYLFRNEGKVEQCELINDRNGKSTGTCFVTYKHESDAIDAVRKYDGCAANGRKISVIHVASTPVKSQIKHNKPIPAANTTRKIDRYVPSERRVSLNAGPLQAFQRGGNNPRATRHKKTVAELDAEIATYFDGAHKGEMPPVGEQGEAQMPMAKAEDDLMEKMGMMKLDDE